MAIPTLTVSVQGRSYAIDPRGVTIIGRAQDCSIVINDQFVSHHHARIMWSPRGWMLEDTNSSNGLTLTGSDGQPRRVPYVVFNPGMTQVRFGHRVVVTFVVTPVQAAPAQTQAPSQAQAPVTPVQSQAQAPVTQGGPSSGDSSAGSRPVRQSLRPERRRPRRSDRPVGSTGSVPPVSATAATNPIPVQESSGPSNTPVSVANAGNPIPVQPNPTANPGPGTGGPARDDDMAFGGTVLAGSEEARLPQNTGVHAVFGTFDPRKTPKGLIGRDTSCAIRVSDVLVSRQHCMVEVTKDGLALSDLRSDNGTYVNGRRIAKIWLRDGDVITIGNTDLEYVGGVIRKREMPIDEQAVIAEDIGLVVDKGKRLLDHVNAVFTRGTLTAVIGPSGAGKSTFTSIVAGLNRPTEGHVIFDGYDVHHNIDMMRSRIGFVPQDDVVHRELTVDAALGYAAKLRLPDASRESRRERVDKVLAELELTEHRAKRVSKLSGGQRKRVSTAIELLTEPELLILDEPTSGLDPALDRTVMEMLRKLADAGRIVIVVTHSLAYVDKVCDNVLMLSPGGHPAFFGTVTEMKQAFGGRDWAEVFSAAVEHPLQRYSIEDPQRRTEAAKRVVPASGRHEKAARKHRIKQTATLVTRQFHLVFADPGLMVFLLLLPLLLGLLSLVVPGSNGFGAADPKDAPTEPSQLLALVILGACFMGSAMTVRDIVSERAIYDRERAVGLSPTSYTVSKLIVSGIETALQSAILVGAVIVGKPHPDSGVLTDSGIPELMLAVWLTAWASALLGSIGSSLVRSGEQTMPLLVILVMAQLVFSGGMIPVTDRDGLEQASMVFPGRWGYSAAASDIGLNDLVKLPTFTKDDLWDQTKDQFWFDIGMLGVMVVVCIVVLRVCVSNVVRSRLK